MRCAAGEDGHGAVQTTLRPQLLRQVDEESVPYSRHLYRAIATDLDQDGPGRSSSAQRTGSKSFAATLEAHGRRAVISMPAQACFMRCIPAHRCSSAPGRMPQRLIIQRRSFESLSIRSAKLSKANLHAPYQKASQFVCQVCPSDKFKTIANDISHQCCTSRKKRARRLRQTKRPGPNRGIVAVLKDYDHFSFHVFQSSA